MRLSLATVFLLSLCPHTCLAQVKAATKGSAEAQQRIADQREQFATHRVAAEELSVLNIAIGAKGRPAWIDAKVLQIVNDEKMIVGLEDSRTGNGRYNTVVILKCKTSGIVDGKFWRGGEWKSITGSEMFKVTETESYLNVLGAKRTVFVLAPMSEEDINAFRSEIAEIEKRSQEKRIAAEQKRVADDPKTQIESAKQKYWRNDSEESASDTEKRTIPMLSGVWLNTVDGKVRQTIKITQLKTGGSFTAYCSYNTDGGEAIRWKLTGRINHLGHINGKLTHLQSPKGWSDQTHIAVLSQDGTTISGRVVFEKSGGHDYEWKKEP